MTENIQYEFPEEEQKKIIKTQRSLKQEILQCKNDTNNSRSRAIWLSKKLKDWDDKLFIILNNLQRIIISQKVMNNSNNFNQNNIEYDSGVFNDLLNHSVQQMFAYLDKVDLNRKAYSIFQKIQHKSQQIHYYTYYQLKRTIMLDDIYYSDSEEDQDFEFAIDKMYYEKNKYQFQDHFDKLLDEQINEMEDEKIAIEFDAIIKDKQENESGANKWLGDFDIFKKVDKILKYAFSKDFKCIFLKLYTINLIIYGKMLELNENICLFNSFIEKKRQYNVRSFNLKNGFERIIKFMIKEYVDDDPLMLLGEKQIELYSSLLLYVLLLENKIPPINFNKKEVMSMKSMKHQLQDITDLLIEKEQKMHIDFNNLCLNLNYVLVKITK